MTRLERHLRKSPGQKSLGPRISDGGRDMNPFTARDADRDFVVLEDIPTVNLGRGVPDPTPGGVSDRPFAADNRDFAVAAMSGKKTNWSAEDPFHMDNPDGYFTRRGSKPMWEDISFTALNVAPRSRRGAAPASVNTYLHVEYTEYYWDAIRDETGVWNVPPPPEMEIERAIYDALKRETVEIGGYGAPFPKYPKESDYAEQDMGSMRYTRRYLRPSRKAPFIQRRGQDLSWRDGDPLYHATPTGLLPKIIKEGLTGNSDHYLWFGTSPSVWNEQWPSGRPELQKLPVMGTSFLRIAPNDEMNETLSKLATTLNSSTPGKFTFPFVVLDRQGNELDRNQVNDEEAYAFASTDATIVFRSISVPAENIEVLNQNGQWIPLTKADFSDLVLDSSGNEEIEAGMSFNKRSVMRMINDITSRKKKKDEPGESREENIPQEPTQVVLGLPRQPPKIGYSNSYGGDDVIKREQRMQRIEHEGMAGSGMWSDIHSDHYDWWAYPIDRGSSAYGETFNVAGEPLERLRNDPEFMRSLAREIEIQALALGWSLYEGKFVDVLNWEKGQDWRRAYPTRFWKMTRSAQIFGLEDEFESLLVLQKSLEDAGIRFNHLKYWENPGTVNEIPPLDSAYEKTRGASRFPASDSISQTDSFWQPSLFTQTASPSFSATDTYDENAVFEDYDNFRMDLVYPTLSDAEELADLLSEPDDVIEFGYPYEKIPKEDRQTIADDIYFAISLLMDGVFPDEEKTDRIESAAQMRKYADEAEGLYPDDGDILYSLADVLEDPELLNDEAIVSEDTDAGMARRARSLDESVSSDDLSLDDLEIQNLIESEVDAATEDFLRGRSLSRVVYRSGDPRPGKPKRVNQFSMGEPVPDEIADEFVLLWNEGKSFVKITNELDLSPEEATYVQAVLFRTGAIRQRKKTRGGFVDAGERGSPRNPLSPEDEEAFIQWHNDGESRELLQSIFELTPFEYARLLEDLRTRRLISPRLSKHYFSDEQIEQFNRIRQEAILESGVERGPTSGIQARIMREMNLDAGQYRALRQRSLFVRRNPDAHAQSIDRSLSKRDIRRFAEMHDDGESSETIRRVMNLSESNYRQLYAAAKRDGLITPRPLESGVRVPQKTSMNASNLFVQLYKEGNKRSEIMRRMGISASRYGYLYSSSRKLGRIEPSRYTRSAITQEKLDAFVSEYNAGTPHLQIAKKLKLNGDQMKTIFRKAVVEGLVKPRGRGSKPNRTPSEIFLREVETFVRLYGAGKSKSQIMQEMGIAKPKYASIYVAAKRRGLITSRPPGRPWPGKINLVSETQNENPEAGMSSELVKQATDEDAQIDLLSSIPGVSARMRIWNTEGSPIATERNNVMKPYFLAPHVDVNKMDSSDPAIEALSPALRRAGLGSYPVDGHVVPKIQGPVVRDFADRFIGPMAVASAVSGTFPSADEILTIYAVNALIRARAEFLSDSAMNADQVNTAILNGVRVGRQGDGGEDFGGSFWKPGKNSARSSDMITNTRPDGGDYEPRYSGTIDPFAYFTGRTDFLRSVIDAMPESVKSKIASYPMRTRDITSWEDVSFFEDIQIREDDELSRTFAPMVRSQAESAIRHAREHQNITKKWAQAAYDLMRESGLNDDEIAYVINEHWVKASSFPLDSVRPGSVLGVAARLGVKAFSARYSPITKVDGRGEEEDYGLHEFFHHYLGQGFTRHGEYVAFRGPMDLADSYHGHLQWAWNVHGQLGMFVSKVMREAFGQTRKPESDQAFPNQEESDVLFNSISRAIYDRLKDMLKDPIERDALFAQVFPELIDADSEDEAKIKELIRKQFAIKTRGFLRFFSDKVPVLRLMTAKDFLVPREYWPYGGNSKIL